MSSGLVDESKKKQSMFERARYILYGERYKNSNMFVKGWYNFRTMWRLSSLQRERTMGIGRQQMLESASKAGDNVQKWYKESGFREAVNQAGSKIASAGKKTKDITVKGAKYAGAYLTAGAQKVYEAGRNIGNSIKESQLGKAIGRYGKNVGGWFASGAAWIKDKADKLARTNTAYKIREAAKTAGHKIAVFGRGAAELGGLAIDKAIVTPAKWLHNSTVGKWVRDKAAKIGKNTAKGVAFLAHHAADAYDNVKSRYIDWKYENDRQYGFEDNRLKEMMRVDEGGRFYEEKLNRFRQDVLSKGEVRSHIRIRSNKDRIRRNAGAMEKGNTGDFELVEMNSEGKFVREEPGEGMLQSLGKYDLANVMIPDTKERKKTKVTLQELQEKEKKSPGKQTGTMRQDLGMVQSGLKKTTGEFEMYMSGIGGPSVPISNFAKAFGNALNIADGKEKQKNMANLLTNLLDEAGKITALSNKNSTFANLANLANMSMGLKTPPKDIDDLNRAKTYIQDIQTGMKMLGPVVKQAGVKNDLVADSFYLGPILTIIEGVDNFNKLAQTNEKLKSLTEEDKSLNLTDKNVIRHIDQASGDLVKQNKDKQVEVVMNTGLNTGLSTAGLATGTGIQMAAISTALSHISPLQLVVEHMKNKTDHELMVEDVFGSREAYNAYKDQYRLRGADIDREILRETGIGSVKEYASRVRAETALHLHSRIKQAEQFGIENGATKLKDAGGLQGKSAKEIYKEIGGREDFDKIVGRKKLDVHKQKLEDYKKRKEEEYQKQVEEKNTSTFKSRTK